MDGCHIETRPPTNAYLVCLIRLAQIMTRTLEQVYRPKHRSASLCRKAAMLIGRDLNALATDIERDFGIVLENLSPTDPHGAREATLVSSESPPNIGLRSTVLIFHPVYNQIMLLAFRPFVMARARYKLTMLETTSTNTGVKENQDTTAVKDAKIPDWLNESCNYALDAARSTIYYFTEISVLDPFVKVWCTHKACMFEFC